jgi:rod shape-determining protein MreC
VAAFGTRSGSPRNRGGSAGFRFSLYALVSVVIMVLDQRLDWLERVHFALQAVTYPVEVVLNSPVTGWHLLEKEFASRHVLEAENRRLRARLHALEMRSLRVDALAAQNAALIGLKHALPPVAKRWLPADIVNIELGGLRQRILVDRGERNGVFRNQAVLDDYGVVGQTIHVGPWSAEVQLITDPDHDLPVQNERTGFRTIAVGTGDPDALALPYLPANADVRVGDVLVTSGLGGVFPSGYPVGRVTEVDPSAPQPLARVLVAPFAHLTTDREVMLLWFRQGNPASPLKLRGGQLTSGNPAVQPLSVPKPKPPPAACTPAPAAQSSGASQPGSTPVQPKSGRPPAHKGQP